MNARKVTNGTLIVASLAAIAVGLLNINSPAHERRQRTDRLREQHLQQIDSSIMVYQGQRKTLPPSLADIEAATHVILPRDPETGAPYAYRKTGQANYRLCATFHLSGTTPNRMIVGSPFATHPAGDHCFELSVKSEHS